MTQGQEEPRTHYCPRCGGRMVRPAGSTLYWHADNDHPRCDITNLVEEAFIAASVEDIPPADTGKTTSSGEKEKRNKKK